MVIKMKNNKTWIILAIILIICIGIGIYLFLKNKNSNNSNYSTSKVSTNEQQSNNSINITSNDSISNNVENSSNNIVNDTSSNTTAKNETQKKEEVLSSFSTKIYNKDSARQNNVSITCSNLNNTIVKNNTTFSFCSTLGPATSAKGYQEADIFDKDGNKKKGLGGGNCQVSTTLYNAVLKVPNLDVTERHEHSNKVPYISQGKDAAVAYGSYDFKFKNNTGYDIKISAKNAANNVVITLYKII